MEFLKSVPKKIAYAIAMVLIIVAIVVNLFDFLTPLINNHRAEVENWISAQVHKPVRIDKIKLAWYHYQPVISLETVKVLNEQNQQSLIRLKKVHVAIAIAQSLWKRKFISSGLTLSGVAISVEQKGKNHFIIPGWMDFSVGHSQKDQYGDLLKPISNWLLAQQHFELENIAITLTALNKTQQLYRLDFLQLQNSDDRHQLRAKLVLQQNDPSKLSWAIQWKGNTLDLSQIRAKIYIHLSNFSLQKWAEHFHFSNWQVKKGIASAKIWATYNRGIIKRVQTSFKIINLNLDSSKEKRTHLINRFSGNLNFERDGQSLIFSGNNIFIDLPQHIWPLTNFYVSLLSNSNSELSLKSLRMGYLDLKDAQDFLQGFLSISIQKKLVALNLSGSLQNISLSIGKTWRDWKELVFSTDFNRVSLAASKFIPGFKDLSGDITWSGNKGELNIHSQAAKMLYPRFFPQQISLDQLIANIQFHYNDQDNSWQLNIPNLMLLNNDLLANASGSLYFPKNTLPTADLNVSFSMQKISRIARYLPFAILDAPLAQWLKSAFITGELKSGHMVLQGPIAHFPFDHNEGNFLVSGNFNQVDMRFAPDWPALRKANGKVVYSKRNMLIEAEQAHILNVPMQQVQVSINHFGDPYPQVLSAKVNSISMNFVQGLQFIHASPLEHNIGKKLDDINIVGDLNLDLVLTVPLKNPEETQVIGLVKFNQASMQLVPWKLELNDLKGDFSFTEKELKADQIQGTLFAKPIQMNIKTLLSSHNGSLIRIMFATDLGVKEVEDWLKLSVNALIAGETHVEGKLDFATAAPATLALSSNLKGLAINLPDAYGKQADEIRDFSAHLLMSEQLPFRLHFQYGDLLSAAVLLSKNNDKFNLISANIALGEKEAAFPKNPGLTISGVLKKINWESLSLGGEENVLSDIAGLPLHQVDLMVQEFEIANQRIPNLHVNIVKSPNQWSVNLSNKDIEGQIDIPTIKQATINANFKKILLPAELQYGQNIKFDVHNLPPIMFKANKLTYGSVNLGQLMLSTIPQQKGILIELFRIVSPNLELHASGMWEKNPKANISSMRGSASSEHVQDLLKQFGFDVRNFISHQGKINFDFSWQGAPYELKLANLNGSAKLELGKGRIVDIGEESSAKMDLGKMLSIFSLQTIPRRLSLDFSDVFQKGYSFDSIKGDFVFNRGEARTRNLHFDGPVAKIRINGLIGLQNKNYNFMLSVTPYVTSSLPVAATLISGPLIGAAAFAVNTLLGSQFSKAVTYYYQVTGPWSNPTWKAVNQQ